MSRAAEPKGRVYAEKEQLAADLAKAKADAHVAVSTELGDRLRARAITAGGLRSDRGGKLRASPFRPAPVCDTLVSPQLIRSC